MPYVANISFEQQRHNIDLYPDLKSSLNSYMIMDPKKEAAHAEKYQSLWRVASIASVIAFVVIAIAVIIFLAVIGSPLLPFVVAGITGLTLPIGRQKSLLISMYDFFKEKSIQHGIAKEVAQGTLEKMHELERADSNALLLKLHSLTPYWMRDRETQEQLKKINPADFKRAYIPILARHDYWVETAKNANALALEYLKTADQLRRAMTAPDAKTEQKIHEYRKEAEEILETQAAPAKIKAAFMIYILQHPFKIPGRDTEKKLDVEISSLGKITPLEIERRALLQKYENQDPYFATVNGKSLGRDWILNHTARQIACEVFSA